MTRSWNAKSIAKNRSESNSPNSTAPVVIGNAPPITGTTFGTRWPIVAPSCIVRMVSSRSETVSETRSGSCSTSGRERPAAAAARKSATTSRASGTGLLVVTARTTTSATIRSLASGFRR